MDSPWPNFGPTVRRLARSLASSLDVSSVYWGVGQRRGQWTDEPCLSVGVRKKHPRRRLPGDRRLPGSIDGVRIDVLEVGAVLGASLSHDDEYFGSAQARSMITCVRVDLDGDRVALLSGHGSLPVIDGKLALTYTHDPGAPRSVLARDADAGDIPGVLMQGSVSGAVDFAVACFGHGPSETKHHLVGEPLVLRSGPLQLNELVYHQPRAHGPAAEGLVVGFSLTPESIAVGPGAVVKFPGVVRVRGKAGGPGFARVGDSGSLVVDAAGAVVGTVVGVNSSLAWTYILPFVGLRKYHPQIAAMFFTES